MIYKDPVGHLDTARMPARRAEDCLNCGESWGTHDGWRCPTVNIPRVKFTELLPNHRFITHSMKGSFNPTNTSISHSPPTLRSPPPPPVVSSSSISPKIVDVSDWRKWRDIGKSEDECACGIYRHDCTFHRPTSSNDVGWIDSD